MSLPEKMKKLKAFYLAEWRFFRKRLLPLFLLVGLCFMALGLATFLVHRGDVEGLRPWLEKLAEKNGWLTTLHPALLSLKIFWNNLRVDFNIIFLGYIPFIFIPLVFFVENALMVGKIAAIILEKGGFRYFWTGILPHGIIEFSTMFYTLSLGLLLCFQRSRRILKKEPVEMVFGQPVTSKSENDLNLSGLFRVFYLIIVPLVLLAAIIEAFITPLIFGLFAGVG